MIAATFFVKPHDREFLTAVSTATAGFSDAIFDPRLGSLTSAKGSVPTPHGLIKVDWQRKGDVIEARIETPEGVKVRTPNPNVRLTPGPSAHPTARDEVVKLAINPINRLKGIP